MLIRILDGYRRYRLPLLLLILAASAIFYGNSCDCSCESAPIEILLGDSSTNMTIWLEEGIELSTSLKLVAPKSGATFSDVRWAIISTPALSILKDGGFQIVPETGQSVTLKLSPKERFGPAGALALTSGMLVSSMQVRADFISSEAGAGSLTDTYIIMPKLGHILVSNVTGINRPDLDRGNWASGKRALVLVYDYDGVIDGEIVIRAYIDTLSGQPYQFSAKTAASKRNQVNVVKVVAVDGLTSEIYLKISMKDYISPMSIPLFVRADGTGGRTITDLVDIDF
jgi:hypothetical protein